MIEIDNQIIGNIMYTKTKLVDESGEEKDILTFGSGLHFAGFSANGVWKKTHGVLIRTG